MMTRCFWLFVSEADAEELGFLDDPCLRIDCLQLACDFFKRNLDHFIRP